jgi:dTDP-glucose pyrophosphorylase
MNSQISLFVLAAGMGSRYGGLKQMESFGPSGETIIDYSIYDALKAGFDKVVFVIRPDMEEDFRKIFLHKYQDRIDIDYCFQTVDMLPSWYKRNPKRTKPWGTTHALLVSRDLINEPFLLINGDDFYGREAFERAANFLREECNEDLYGVMTYPLKNVMSKSGTVKRGICSVDENGLLERLDETFEIQRNNEDKIEGVTWDGVPQKDIDEETPTSMNMFCYHPNVFEIFEKEFNEFLKELENDLEDEYIMAVGLNTMIAKGKIKMKILTTPSEWFGVTYPEDAQIVRKKLKELVEKGEYPKNLWS